MSSVDRYNVEAVNDGGELCTESHKSSDGAWVRYEDHAAALRAERAKLTTPNMFWEEDCDGDSAVEDPSEIADRLDIGAVFCLMCARSLPDAYFVVGVDERGCTTATPATDEQIAEYKFAEKAERDRRQAEFDRRNAASGAVRAVPFPDAKEPA